MHFDLKFLLTDLATKFPTLAYVGLFGIIFAESGLFFGFFLPGDSLLIVIGLLASQNILNIQLLIPLLAIAAISGDSVGYWFGKKMGPRIFKKDNSLLFDKNHLVRASEYYKEHGGKTIILARFLPVIRTFAPIVAGVGNMDYKKFLTYNIVGGIGWTAGMLLFGYFLGNVIPDVDKYLIPLILIIIFVSLMPSMWEHRRQIRNKLGSMYRRVFSKFQISK